jgi:hypothetical protein
MRVKILTDKNKICIKYTKHCFVQWSPSETETQRVETSGGTSAETAMGHERQLVSYMRTTYIKANVLQGPRLSKVAGVHTNSR